MAGVDRTTGGRDIIWQPVFCTLRPRYHLLPYSVIFFGRGGRTGDLHTSARCAHALIRHQRIDHCIVANLSTRRDMIDAGWRAPLSATPATAYEREWHRTH